MWFCCLQREVIDLSMYLCIVNYLFIFMLWCILYCIECLVLESWTIIFCKYKRGEKQRWKGRRRLQVDDSQELLSTVLFGTLEKYELANLTLSPIENWRKTETMRRIRWQYLSGVTRLFTSVVSRHHYSQPHIYVGFTCLVPFIYFIVTRSIRNVIADEVGTLRGYVVGLSIYFPCGGGLDHCFISNMHCFNLLSCHIHYE